MSLSSLSFKKHWEFHSDLSHDMTGGEECNLALVFLRFFTVTDDSIDPLESCNFMHKQK